MKYINFLLILAFTLFIGNIVIADPYPAPDSIHTSIGMVDSILISWSTPTPPQFGEGFEAGSIPPEGWSLQSKNEPYTWQIMDNHDYVHSGSYSASVPWSDSSGTFLGYGDENVSNGSFDTWTDDEPNDWEVDVSIDIDSLNMTQDILAISSSSNTAYVGQNFNLNKYSHYKLVFRSKQDSTDMKSSYKLKILTTESDEIIEETLDNETWEDFERDIYTSSHTGFEIRLFTSDAGNEVLVYWDDISIKEYLYDPYQDEWLISPEYLVSPSDILTFYLGTSKMYGPNAPVFVLLSTDNGNNWTDTLKVCDGADHDYETWGNSDGDLEKFDIDFGDYITSEQSVKIAFRYLGGNGDLVCLDDVIIGNEKTDLRDWFVIKKAQPKVKYSPRAPIQTRSKDTILTGYSIYRKQYATSQSYKKVSEVDVTNNSYPDTTNLSKNYAYIYRVKAIYNTTIESNFSISDTGAVFDETVPAKPLDVRFRVLSDDWTETKLSYTLHWSNPLVYDDLWRYKLNILNTDIFFEFLKDPGEYDKKILSSNPTGDQLQLSNEVIDYTLASVDFNGNEKVDTLRLLPPPKFKTQEQNYSNKVIISKWEQSQVSTPADSIKLYRSLTENIDDFELYKTITDPSNFINGTCEYIDSDVETTQKYWYYATINYQDSLQSDRSKIYDAEPNSTINSVNISNTNYTIIDTSIIFTWDEPAVDSLSYGGLYIYYGTSSSPIDTVFIGTTTYEYMSVQPRIVDLTLCPFDYFGKAKDDNLVDGINNFDDLELGLDYLPICMDTTKHIEDFEDGIDPLWTQINEGDPIAVWFVTNDGSSQWFDVTTDPTLGQYAIINDDIVGQFVHSDCYLMLPPMENIVTTAKVFLYFDGFLGDEYDGSAYIILKNENGEIKNIIDLYISEQYTANEWKKYIFNLTPYLENYSSFDYFQIGFYYNDNTTWSQGFAIDNVALLSSYIPENSIATKFSNDENFHYYKKFPNPFIDNVHFSFILKEQSKVEIDIYNIKGQRITHMNETCNSGLNKLTWNGLDNHGYKIPSGIYLYRIQINDTSKIGKIIRVD